VARIRGSKTGVKSPDGIAVDPSGVVYVSSSANSSIREFDSGRTGNVSPSAIISGGGTGLGAPIGLALAPAQKLLVQTTALPDGPLLGHYHARITLAGAGNVLPDTFSLTNLPPGLSFDSPTQSIEGTPTAEGTYVVDVRVSDSAARPDQAQSELTLVITPPPPALYATSD